MAAYQTVPDFLHDRKPPVFIVPRHGVLTIFGYGIKIYVERGHLTIEDGIGADRRRARLPRVGHGLRRLVLIGSDGFVSLSALRWLADQDASFVMLERSGSVLAVTGPVCPSDARLRRAQSLAIQSGIALRIARELIRQKLEGQEKLVRGHLHSMTAADEIAKDLTALQFCQNIDQIRQFEAHGANAYWFQWRLIPVNFPIRDLHRVPDHWRRFGTRKSPLTGSPRLAVNPANAILNYLYALLESEARLALAALGLDPGIGVMHVDSRTRDSLACDLMEAVRPQVDAYVLSWITSQPLRREWFFEERDGNCRLMTALAVQLSQTCEMWRRAVSPIAEWISRALWSTLARPSRQTLPATRLTQCTRRQAKGGAARLPKVNPPQPTRVCQNCGKNINPRTENCASCGKENARRNLIEVAKLGRIATHSPRAEALRGVTQRRQAAALKAWKEAGERGAFIKDDYRQRILPCLNRITVGSIAAVLQISEPYAAEIRSGRRVPHPRHWERLAALVGI